MAQTSRLIWLKKSPFFFQAKNSLNILGLLCRFEEMTIFIFLPSKKLLKYTGVFCSAWSILLEKLFWPFTTFSNYLIFFNFRPSVSNFQKFETKYQLWNLMIFFFFRVFRRRPAWTDRILFRVNSYNYEDDNVELSLEAKNYQSHKAQNIYLDSWPTHCLGIIYYVQ